MDEVAAGPGISPEPTSAGPSGSVPPLWCPFCQAPMAESMFGVVTCAACHREVDVHAARRASDEWLTVVAARARYDALRAAAADLEVELQIEYADVSNRQDRWERANHEAQHAGVRTPAAAHPPIGHESAPAATVPVVTTPVRAAHATHADAQPKPRIPMAVLLQGTGAVLLLAALVALSAVLWGSLPGWGQVSLLCAAVVLIGALAVVTRRAIPTTSVVLAVLAAAALVVVLLAAPSLLMQWQTSLYPGLAASIFTAVALLAGKFTGIRFWWLTGVASIPATAVLLTLSLLSTSEVDLRPRWVLAVTTALLAPVVVALMMWSRRTRTTDRETAVTAWVVALLSSGLLTLVAIAALIVLLLAEPVVWLPAKAPWLVVVTAATAVLTMGAWIAAELSPWWRKPCSVLAGALAGGGLAALTIMPGRVVGIAVAMGIGAVLLAAALRWLSYRWASWRLLLDVASVVFGLAALSVQCIGAINYREFERFGMLAGPPELGLDNRWLWLSATILGVGLGGLAVAEGLWRRLSVMVLGGYALAAFAWAFGWSFGEVGGSFEVVTVAAGAVALGVLWVARRRGLLPQVPWPAVVLVAAAPTLLVALADPEFVESATWWRVLGVATATGLAVALPERRWPVVSVIGWAMWLVLPWWAYVVWVSPETGRLPELITVPTAFAFASVAAWWVEPRTRAAWWSVLRWPLLAVTLVSASWALALPFPGGELTDQVRVAVVVVGGLAVALTCRQWRAPAAVAGSVAVVVAWWSIEVALVDRFATAGLAVVEVVSLPTALAITAVLAFVLQPQTPADWRSVVQWPLAVAAAISVCWSLLYPFSTPGLAAPVRVVVVVVASVVVTATWWRHRVLAAIVGSVGILVVWRSLAAVLPPMREAVEWQTLPAAVAVAGVMALIVRARGGLARMPLGSGVAFGLPAGLALVPTAIVAVGELSDGVGPTLRFALVVAAAAGAVGVGAYRRLGGLLFAGLLALAIAVGPVLFNVVESLPVWVPLVLVGATLLVIGARLEHVRRRGSDAVHWLVHLR
ncbi:MAG: hypothetical protein QG597_4056 [Actinomycetota bacterium]|nr:hypothetical protein [Actinomycetota bacterium]